MHVALRTLLWVLAWTLTSPAWGGLVVTSFRTVAQTNGYAPTSGAQYFAEQRLENVTPAVAEVSGDWTGPNADGTPNTWHFVGTSRATSTTTITSDSYTVEATASFSYALETTPAFTDPASINIFTPGASANYVGFFETDVPLFYSMRAQLNQLCRVRLSSFAGAVIFNERDTFPTPRLVLLSGTIPAGRYQLLATSSLGLGNRPPGMNYVEHSGALENLVFSVRVPEPSVCGTLLAACLLIAKQLFRISVGR